MIMVQLGLRVDLKRDANILEAFSDDVRMAELKNSHSFCFVVDEHVPEAAAVTYETNMTSCLYSPPPIDVIIDHPFIFMTREDNSCTRNLFWSYD